MRFKYERSSNGAIIIKDTSDGRIIAEVFEEYFAKLFCFLLNKEISV